MRMWIALALLAGSWLWGLGYYQPANGPAWAAMVVLGTLLLTSTGVLPGRFTTRREVWATPAIAMLLPAAWFLPWPYRAAPLLMIVGLTLECMPIPRRWPAAVGSGALAAGGVLLVQALAMLSYAFSTSRSHDLPGPLVWLVGAIVSLLGAEAAVDGPFIVIRSVREVYRLTGTWDLLVDPATFSFFLGGLALLAMVIQERAPAGQRWSLWMRASRLLAVGMLLWLPIRVGLLIALLLHRSMRAEMAVPLVTMNQWLSPWVALLALAGAVVLAWWLVRLPAATLPEAPEAVAAASGSQPARRGWAAVAMVLSGAAILAFVIQWDPIGKPKGGRVMVVERHSTWEPTTRPYDTASYGEDASYTYAAIYDYCSRYYTMSRLMPNDAIDDATLSTCDVLVVKIPTEPYASQELEAIARFVRRGGGLLLIGDHTNYLRSSTYLNDIARPFGFKFAHDLLFQVGSPYIEWHDWPWVRHPVLVHVPSMYFAGSCTIEPGMSWGRAVVRSTAKWSLPPDYHADNYFPQAEYRPYMRCGAFIQVWATRYGRGRVLAFTDSTIFSNFSTFEPGKAELMLGMLQWLNYASPLDPIVLRLPLILLGALVGVAVLLGGVALAVPVGRGWVELVSAGVLGATLALTVVAGLRQVSFPAPAPVRPMTRIVIDRTVSEVPLSRGGFTDESGRGYGLLEQWIPRLGYFTARRSGSEAVSGDALVIICPTRSVSDQFRRDVEAYVRRGGRLLLIDSPDSPGTTANSLLWPFGLSVKVAEETRGALRASGGGPDIPVEASFEVSGGQAFLWVNDTPVAARTRYGKGSVMAVGFGAVLNDTAMGGHWMLEPNADQLARYRLLYALLRSLMTGRPVAMAGRGGGVAP